MRKGSVARGRQNFICWVRTCYRAKENLPLFWQMSVSDVRYGAARDGSRRCRCLVGKEGVPLVIDTAVFMGCRADVGERQGA